MNGMRGDDLRREFVAGRSAAAEKMLRRGNRLCGQTSWGP